MKLSELKEKENKGKEKEQPQSGYGGEGEGGGKGYNGATLGERRGESSKVWVIIVLVILCLIIFTDIFTDIDLVDFLIGIVAKIFDFAKSIGEWIQQHSRI